MDVSNHKFEYEEIIDMLERDKERMNQLMEKSTIRDTIDTDFVNDLMIEIRRFFQSRVRECIARNEKREEKVPVKATPCTQNKLQLPEYAELIYRMLVSGLPSWRQMEI